jgi:hypothetical protein
MLIYRIITRCKKYSELTFVIYAAISSSSLAFYFHIAEGYRRHLIYLKQKWARCWIHCRSLVQWNFAEFFIAEYANLISSHSFLWYSYLLVVYHAQLYLAALIPSRHILLFIKTFILFYIILSSTCTSSEISLWSTDAFLLFTALPIVLLLILLYFCVMLSL